MTLDLALRYVHNCSGRATRAEFIKDHELVKEHLVQALLDASVVAENGAG